MELELKTLCLDAFESGGDVNLAQEETAETIVPDYCPDIARIIRTDGTVHIHGQELRDGKGEITGCIKVAVLYTPDGESGIRALEFAVPFTVACDHRALAGAAHMVADITLESVETRMLNPRKVFTHCKLAVHLTGYRKTRQTLCTDLEAEEPLCLQKKLEQQRMILLTQIIEKDFTFTEEMSISPGKDGAAELLSAQAAGNVTECRIVGNKLVFKGLVSLSMLYRTTEGRCACHTAELPFSQIMEAEGASEAAAALISLQLKGSDFRLDEGNPEGRQIAVTLYLHATALLREEREVTLLSDLYSTAYETAYDAEPLAFTGFFEPLTRRQTVREVLEIGVIAETILSLSACCGPVTVQREGETTVLRTTATIRALYLDEGNVPLVAERNVEVSCHLELPEDCHVTARAACCEEIRGNLGDRGIEVRFPVDFFVETDRRAKKLCITGAKVDHETPRDLSGAPSLVLRCLGAQESAWDLAKQHNTTIGAILSANLLETEGDIPRDRLLLIPRKRA